MIPKLYRFTDAISNAALAFPEHLGLVNRESLIETVDYLVQADFEKALDPAETQATIRRALDSPEPFLVSRFGSTEMRVVLRHFNRQCRSRGEKLYALATRLESPVWVPWEHRAIRDKSGFFPVNELSTKVFSQLMLESMGRVDLLGSWIPGENQLRKFYSQARITRLSSLSPFGTRQPWTSSLRGKKVLVIHPFASSIRTQYNKRRLLFSEPDFLPEFELFTIQAVQSLGTPPPQFSTWFDALDHMHQETREIDFDVALIGCGAYGFPLGARIKEDGKKAIVLGGLVQLLFGIKGKRWDESGLYNEQWVRPLETEKPKGYFGADRGAYW